jgi:hypothetical protein
MYEEIATRRPAGTTDADWAALALAGNQLAGRLGQVREQRTMENGRGIAVTRQASKNRRLHPMRFIRA